MGAQVAAAGPVGSWGASASGLFKEVPGAISNSVSPSSAFPLFFT